MTPQEPTIEEFLSAYAAPVQRIAHNARASIAEALPACTETLDSKARVIGFGYGAGYTDTVAVLIMSKTGVKLGIAYGSTLPDPKHLLQGKGRVHRHIPLTTAELIASRPVKTMLRNALLAYRKRRKAKS